MIESKIQRTQTFKPEDPKIVNISKMVYQETPPVEISISLSASNCQRYISASTKNQHLALADFASTSTDLLEMQHIYIKTATNISFDEDNLSIDK